MKNMSTENNSELLFKNSVKILTDLISFKTISGEDNNSLIDYCDNILKNLGATSFRTFDDHKKRVNFETNLRKHGKKNDLKKFYRSLAELNLGRQITIYSLLK